MQSFACFLVASCAALTDNADSDFPVVFVDKMLEQRLRAEPGLLKMRNLADSSKGNDDAVKESSSGLLRFSDLEARPGILGSDSVAAEERSRAQAGWDEPCTIRRLPQDERPTSADAFMRKYASTPLILQRNSAMLPQLPRLDAAAAQRTQHTDLVSCLCAPVFGTNFMDTPVDDLATGPYAQSKRMCLWKYGMLLPFVTNGTTAAGGHGTVSNPDLAPRLKFQCRIGSSSGGGKVVQELANSLLTHNGRFWQALGPPVESSVWLSTPHTRTPLHSDPFLQFFSQVHGTKHITLYEAGGFHGSGGSGDGTELSARDSSRENGRAQTLAWGHGGLVNASGFRGVVGKGGDGTCAEQGGCMEGEAAASEGAASGGAARVLQRCLLREGEMLWLPPDYLHDVYTLEPSCSISLRWPKAKVAQAGGKLLINDAGAGGGGQGQEKAQQEKKKKKKKKKQEQKQKKKQEQKK
jgi:hypothetical protein